ncbi:hypothetical protein FRB95_000598 [Tulasnella sp. JGI-2019a]|nr:hypothetical protein FRB95_000598 [Tulasnella sp. JGI-2019a]
MSFDTRSIDGNESGSTQPLEGLLFEGTVASDATAFLVSVKRVTISQGRQRNDTWMADHAESCPRALLEAIRLVRASSIPTLPTFHPRALPRQQHQHRLGPLAWPLSQTPSLPIEATYQFDGTALKSLKKTLTIGDPGVGNTALFRRQLGFCMGSMGSS